MALIPSELARDVKFLVRQRVRGISVPDVPQFDAAGLKYFVQRLTQSRFYLEYGCGGSTIFASHQKKPFISVESDPFYLDAVRKKLLGEIGPICGQLIHADIGTTVEWGTPLIKRKSPRRLQRWAKYATSPWTFIQPDSVPDLILIDGRFRVHCALFSILRMQGRDFEIAFDDYETRPHYHVVEKFAHLKAMHGRMAVFKPAIFDANALNDAIESFSSDYR